jgi:hypothetical protein
LVAPIVTAIVGVHFVGLWFATGNQKWLWLEAALCGVGIIGLLVPPAARLPTAGIGSAPALWASPAWQSSADARVRPMSINHEPNKTRKSIV